MSVDAHRQAVQLMSEAEVVDLQGDHDSAVKLYRQAAEFEIEALQHVPPSRSRTRGMIAVSAVNLYRASGNLLETIRYAHFCLAQSDLPELALKQINEILYAATRELRFRENNQTLDNPSFLISLSGGTASSGAASYDAVIWELQQFLKYIIRVTEWVAKQPFRSIGPPSASLLAWCTPMLSAPSLGSIEFQVLFQTPMQPYLPGLVPQIQVAAESVTTECLNIIETVVDQSPADLEHVVPDQKYRSLFLKVIRNIAPSGKEIGEIRFNRISPTGNRSLRLNSATRVSIGNYIRSNLAKAESGTQFAGILRELSLDHEWITVVEDGHPRRLKVQKSEIEGFDDFVGPLVNKSVRVTGYWSSKRQPQFYVRDIELAE